MNAADFRPIALSSKAPEKARAWAQPIFRAGGRLFATLASEKQDHGNLMLTPEQ
jgi:hypothetical protein